MTDRSVRIGGAIAFALLCIVAIWHKLPDIEEGVMARTASALDSAGIEYESIDAIGRTAHIVLPRGSTVSDGAIDRAIGVGFIESVFRTKVVRSRPIASPAAVSSTTAARRAATAEPLVEPGRPPALRLEVRGGVVLSLTGRVGSPADASALAALVGPPRGWNLIEDRETIALPSEVLAIIEAATAALSEGHISFSDGALMVTGTYAATEAATRFAEFRNQVGGNFTATYDIVDPAALIDAAIEKIDQLGVIRFDSGTTAINPTSHATLDEIAAILLANSRLHITIRGHTDSVGDAAANLRLSVDRADAVAAYLVGSGVANESLSTQGFGGSQPVADNSTAEGRSLNRRIVFVATREGAGS